MVYGRAFFPLERAVGVVPGDKRTTHLTAKRVKGDFVYRWKSVVTGGDGAKKAAFDQLTFKALLISAAELRKVSGDYVASLNEEGQVAQRVLQGMTGQQPLMEIAKNLSAQFPQRFRNAESALEVVARLSKAYS